ncbi:MAG: xanthine phosphoribosyltransferase [Mogibacterium sp.]|nr:xanthine phosphoribosyltransferase [Mogibacterium sp.]
MKALEDKILAEGMLVDGSVLNVGKFLNQQIDTVFLKEIGEEIRRLFEDSGATKILTVEASGIAVAVAAGMAMDLPVIFAKKSRTANISGEVYSSLVYSFTHDRENHIMVSKAYLPAAEKILIVDDFLAHGSALNGLIAIAEDAGCEVVGCCAVIEKGFQMGGDNLRARGYRVESLAIIDQMDETGIVFRLQ